MEPTRDELKKLFWWPDNADEKTGVRVTLQYLSPEVVADVGQQYNIRIAGKDEEAPADRRRALVNEVLLRAVIKIDGMTLGKLQEMVPISAKKIMEAGGFDVAVPLDPSNPGECVEAKENLIYLLTKCDAFATWATRACQNIGLFQDDKWRADAIKNFSTGGGSPSDQTQSSPTTPAS